MLVIGFDQLFISFKHQTAPVMYAKQRINLTDSSITWRSNLKSVASSDSITSSITLYSSGRKLIYSVNLWSSAHIFTITTIDVSFGYSAKNIIKVGPSCTEVINSFFNSEQIQILAQWNSEYVILVYNPILYSFGYAKFINANKMQGVALESKNARYVYYCWIYYMFELNLYINSNKSFDN